MNTDTAPNWKKTRLNNMVRHTNGRYYARLYRNGKEIWKSLMTEHFSVAETKLSELQKDHRQNRGVEVAANDVKMKFGQAAAIVGIKSGTRKYWRETRDAVLKSWPGLEELEIRKISENACGDWASRWAKQTSDNRYINSVSLMRHIFDVAKESGRSE